MSFKFKPFKIDTNLFDGSVRNQGAFQTALTALTVPGGHSIEDIMNKLTRDAAFDVDQEMKDYIDTNMKRIGEEKNMIVREQRYEDAAKLRDEEKVFLRIKDEIEAPTFSFSKKEMSQTLHQYLTADDE